MSWVALFSQSGSEIKRLCMDMNRTPEMVLTNNINRDEWGENMPFAHARKHDVIMDVLRDIEPCEITLHGYLRIIPKDICDRHNIVNGHPGLITDYPELIGKDPQERITPDMKYIGSVCHEVIAEVDEGNVITSAMVKNTGKDYYNVLKETSFMAWRQYFERSY